MATTRLELHTRISSQHPHEHPEGPDLPPTKKEEAVQIQSEPPQESQQSSTPVQNDMSPSTTPTAANPPGTQPTNTSTTRRFTSSSPNPEDNDDRATVPFLDKWDVAALIINKMVGTGIFTGPPLVLLYTQNKVEAMLLWVVGLIYTILWYDYPHATHSDVSLT